MTAGTATFLGSASERLLPPGIVFRFFGTAVIFHAVAWAVVAMHGEQLSEYRGGSGPILAALHLVTLGVFTMTAMGASLQLLPVATLQGFAAPGAISALWWLFTAGTICLTVGMYWNSYQAMILGGGAVTLSVVFYLCLLVGNLRQGGAMAVVVAHGRLAAFFLVVLLVLGLALIINQRTGMLADSQRAGISHMLLAAYGFMGLLAMGFSYVLIPMFALAPNPPDRWALLALICICVGLALGVTGTWLGRDAWAAVGGGLGLLGGAVHVALMVLTLRRRMRKRLGPAFTLIRLSWALFLLSLLLGTAWTIDLSGDWGPAMFGLALLGWLLSLLLAILQRIVPFLASMHAAANLKRRPPTVTALTAPGPLAIHLCCHCGALALLALGILLNLPLLVKLGAVLGLAGALAFVWFFYLAMAKFRTALSPLTP
ncbi:MAG: hypothetical protein HN732_16340 [Rhodospirillaceae bacterium]|jgi:hypothetical protein|nr:hypothetical protein [Rhodospirillaceae bacterium]MBT5899265.1 hypothetical protein [Rhodospirillaceae bacterium]MBT7664591.1 hypothetical protein [Rhodospirillaceae bacterium]MBT7758901.1 hypothetical protein [Rhodospirillaceae bacterium]